MHLAPARTRAVRVAAAVALGLGLVAAAARRAARAATAATTAATAATPHGTAMLAASRLARSTGRGVPVPAATTELSTTTANPDGSYTMTTSLLPSRVRQGGRWVAVSPALHRAADGSVVPAAVPSAVTLSGGGTAPLVRLTSLAGGRLSVRFPARLRAPVLDGATATYQSAVRGVSVQVTVSPLGGVTEAVLASAGVAPARRFLRRLALPYAASQLAVSADKTGNLTAAGPRGQAEFSGTAPIVSTAAATAPQDSRAGAGQPHGLYEPVRARVTAGRITLPLTGALAAVGPSATGPSAALSITSQIVPDITSSAPGRPAVSTTAAVRSASPAADARLTAASLNDPIVQSHNGFVETQNGKASDGTTHCDTLQNWNVETDPNGNAIATNAWDYCQGLDQSYYMFDTSAITASMHITQATLNIWENSSANEAACSTSYPVILYDLGDTNSVVGLDTNELNEPNLTSDEEVGTDNVDLGPNANSANNCPQRTVQYNVLSDMQTVAQYGDINYWNYGLQSGDKSDSDAFARFGYNPNITTRFDMTPPAPTYELPTPAPVLPGGGTSRGCSGATPWVGATTSLRLNADFEPTATMASNGENVYPEWKWSNYDTSGSSGVDPLATTNVSPGTQSLTIPTIADGEAYTYQAATRVNFNGDDSGNGYTTWGPDCTFNLDLTPPDVPTVTSTTFPPSGSTTPNPVQGTSGTFGFTSADPPPASCSAVLPAGSGHCLASGVAEFVYSVNQPPPASLPTTTGCTGSGPAFAISATTSGSTATATSCATTAANWGTNILYVEAVDNAGNVSQSAEYDYYVTWNKGAAVTPGDVNGDGVPDLLATTTSGNLLLYPGGQDPALAPVTASTAADSPQPGTGWNQFQVTHRGSWTPSQEVDDLFALKGANLYRYVQGTETGAAPQFEDEANVTLMDFPACPTTAPGADPVNTGNCTGYPSSWSGVGQILAPGDAWAGDPSGTGTADDTGFPSLLAVDSGTGSLWLFQGRTGGQLQDPIQLGSSGWGGMTIIAPGTVGGQNTLWARDNSTGAVYSYPFVADPASGIPTLDPAKPGTPVTAEGTGSTGTQIPRVSLPQASYPTVTSPGPLTGGTCTTGSVTCPGLYAEDTSGRVWYYPGQPTTGGAAALTGNSLLVGTLGSGG